MAHEYADKKQDRAGATRAQLILKNAGYADRTSTRQDRTDPAAEVYTDNLKYGKDE
jgi:hypothetical protein